jgi:hypothetical protein
MITCIEREGERQCSWWWNEQCHNAHVAVEIKMVCNGKLQRLLPKMVMQRP